MIRRRLRSLVTPENEFAVTRGGLSLLRKMLRMDKRKRYSATDVLGHPYVRNPPQVRLARA